MKVVYFSLLLLSGNAIRNSLFQHRRTFTYQPANGVDKKTALFGYRVGMADDNLSLLASSPGQINSDGSNQGGIWKCVISDAAGLCPLMSHNTGVGSMTNII
ncbi:hypothetical protein RF11_05156 [Thelohanellus kitauei]|uniref:Uncharacterized protein n=1 Tax=Thelohanellus kitauei TaxID=669202 RepID=A0A0C2IJE3_THEKT|nr:hypothetical protein RF11_05156 [Thelohanellus kitauei]